MATMIEKALTATAITAGAKALGVVMTAEGNKDKATLALAKHCADWAKSHFTGYNGDLKEVTKDYANKCLAEAGIANKPNLRNLMISAARRHAIYDQCVTAAEDYAKAAKARRAKGEKVSENETKPFHNLVRGLANEGTTADKIAAAYAKPSTRKPKTGTNESQPTPVNKIVDASALAEAIRAVGKQAASLFDVSPDTLATINTVADTIAAAPKKAPMTPPKIEAPKAPKAPKVTKAEPVAGAIDLESLVANMAQMQQGLAMLMVQQGKTLPALKRKPRK